MITNYNEYIDKIANYKKQYKNAISDTENKFREDIENLPDDRIRQVFDIFNTTLREHTTTREDGGRNREFSKRSHKHTKNPSKKHTKRSKKTRPKTKVKHKGL